MIFNQSIKTLSIIGFGGTVIIFGYYVIVKDYIKHLKRKISTLTNINKLL